MESQNQATQAGEIKGEGIKSRKTLDQYLGINGLCGVALIGTILGGILRPIGAVAGVSAIYYLIKKRKELSASQKWTGWILVAMWLVLFGVISGSFNS